MKSEHIINLIESGPLDDLKESDLVTVRAHASSCTSCNEAFQAARISALLLKEHAAEKFEPTPFFQTRVLAALRERQNEQWSWSRIWQATGALASSMVATVAAIAVLTFVIPGLHSEPAVSDLTAGNLYSAEEVVLNQSDLPDNQVDQISDGQVLTALYEAEEEVK
jgi:hypothetical protein